MPLFDVTLPISVRLPVWPGDPPVQMPLELSIDQGDDLNLTRLNISAHTGTHIDAPRHYLRDGASIDALPLDWLIGPALVVAMDAADIITAADLEAAAIPTDMTRLLLKTSNSRQWEQPLSPVFHEDFVALDVSAALWLVERGIRLIGVDGLGVEPFHAAPGAPVHTTLLQAGIVILEGLNLSAVAPGAYTLIALPLKLEGADGAPARVVLMDTENNNG